MDNEQIALKLQAPAICIVFVIAGIKCGNCDARNAGYIGPVVLL